MKTKNLLLTMALTGLVAGCSTPAKSNPGQCATGTTCAKKSGCAAKGNCTGKGGCSCKKSSSCAAKNNCSANLKSN